MVEKIGEAAGTVWKALNEKGGRTLGQLKEETRLSSDLLHQAIGWLAREGKLDIQKEKRGSRISLR